MSLGSIALLLACAISGTSAEPPSTPPTGVYVPAPLQLTADDVPRDLVEIPSPPATRVGLRLRADAWNALEGLLRSARDEGLEIRVLSAYRSFEYQARLYHRALRRHGAGQKWVAAPGTSEHQLGTTVDLADGALEHVLESSFADCAEGKWIARNAARFGFVVSYTQANEPWTGYRPEPWHLRFLPEPTQP